MKEMDRNTSIIVAVGVVLLGFVVGWVLAPDVMATLAVVCFVGLLVAGVVVAWLIPVWIAFRREHPNRTAILVVNLLFGWTFVGWGLSLAWALSNPAQSQTVVINNTASSPAAAPNGVTSAHAVPAELPTSNAVGDIVNGYRFDGAQWVPVNPTYPAR